MLLLLTGPPAAAQPTGVAFTHGDLPRGWERHVRSEDWYFVKEYMDADGFYHTDIEIIVKPVSIAVQSETDFEQFYYREVNMDSKSMLFLQDLNDRPADWKEVLQYAGHQGTRTTTLDGYPAYYVASVSPTNPNPLRKQAYLVNVDGLQVLVYAKATGANVAEADAFIRTFRFGGRRRPEGPDRVRITVTSSSADPQTGQVTVNGTIASRSPITSASFIRAEGGIPTSCHIQHNGERFTASCDFVAGERNVFKIVFDNEAELSAEQTLTYDATGTMTDQRTTSETGDVTTAVPPPVMPGLGPVGNLPGPRNLTEGVVGVLGPGLVGILTGLFGGLFGGGPGSAPPVAPPPPARRTRKPKGKTDEDTAEEPDNEQKKAEEQEKKKPEAAKKKRRREREPTPPEQKADKDKETEKEKEKDKAEEPLGPDEAAKQAEHLLDRLEKKAETMASPELNKAIEEARKHSFGPDGTLDPKAWAEARKQLRDALDDFTARPPEESSLVGELWQGTKNSAADLVDKVKAVPGTVKDAAVGVGKGVGNLFVSGYEGGKAIGDAILNPRYVHLGLKKMTGDWIAKNAPDFPEQFQRALKEGRSLDALGLIAKTNARMGWDAVRSAGRGLGHMAESILPVDEFRSLFDPNMSTEDKAWAVASAAAKIATLILPTKYAKTRVPGLGSRTTLIRSARPGWAAGQTAKTAGARAAQLEKQAASAERAAASQTGPGGAKEVASKLRKAAAKARAQQVEQLAAEALPGQSPFQNYGQAQQWLNKNPKLRDAIDHAIRNEGGTGSLYDLRLGGTMGKDAHTLVTARRLQLQEQAVNAAGKRILQEETQAMLAAGEKVPNRFMTANSTEGSRQALRGSNAACDLDQTYMGLKHVPKDRVEAILQEECKKLGFDQTTLDTNIYVPPKGRLMDVTGPTPNSEAWLQRSLQREPGRSGYHQVHVTKDGRALVSDHVGAQGAKALPIEKELAAPVKLTSAQQTASVRTQLKGLTHAAERNNLNQMAKYGARAIKDGHVVDAQTRSVIMKVASQKDPYEALQILKKHGIHNADDLMTRMNIPSELLHAH